MNRSKFALSWGRKLFFGASWPLSTLLGLIYLKSYILPVSNEDWIYLIATIIGQFGILNAAVYFLLYCPVILILPTYYVTRLWSLLLILTLNLLILSDALSFTSYGFHLTSPMSQLYLENGFQELFGTSGPILIGVGLLVLSVLLWIRGEITWRFMQGRFSNPVKNWYLVLIVMGFAISLFFNFQGIVHSKLSEVFPLNVNMFSKQTYRTDNRKFLYPKEELTCSGKNNPNVVLITVKNWQGSMLNAETMPKTFHLLEHGMTFTSHHAVASNPEQGKFSLLYSIPATYQSAAVKTESALIQELIKRKYELVNDNYVDWLEKRSGEEILSYFLDLNLEVSEADEKIHDLILKLQRDDLLFSTHILITAVSSNSPDSTVPLLWFTPERKRGEVKHLTTNYDVIPSLMEKAWGCKNVFSASSVGMPLSSDKSRDWYVFTTDKGFKIVDLKEKGVITVENGSILKEGNARKELIFSALKTLQKFTRP